MAAVDATEIPFSARLSVPLRFVLFFLAGFLIFSNNITYICFPPHTSPRGVNGL